MSNEELLEDEDFAAKVEEAKSLKELAGIFGEKGVKVTVAELESAMKEDANGELDEDGLENVAGGSILNAWKQFIRSRQHQGSSGGWHSGSGRHG